MSHKEKIFHNLFVLELANNHWGDIDRGLRIIREHGKLVKKYGINAAMKFQFRETKSFIHPDFLDSEVSSKDKELHSAPGTNTRYVKKTLSTLLSEDEYKILLDETRKYGMHTMSTPFDEDSVAMCKRLNVDIMKIASQDAKSWTIIEKIAKLNKPTIISNGGHEIGDLDKVVEHFAKVNVPLAINHCVSLYPSEDSELELNQVDFLKNRYPNNVIGFSTHEYSDWTSSVMITYAKGARSWERHIDIEANGIPVSKYCSLPHQVEEWFKAFKKAEEMCGHDGNSQRVIPEKEKEYISSVSRGIYATRELPAGFKITKENLNKDFYLAIPAQTGQRTSRDLNEVFTLNKKVGKDKPIMQ